MRVIGVNGKKFSRERLADALADSVALRKIEFLMLEGDGFRTVVLDYATAPVSRVGPGREEAGRLGGNSEAGQRQVSSMGRNARSTSYAHDGAISSVKLPSWSIQAHKPKQHASRVPTVYES